MSESGWQRDSDSPLIVKDASNKCKFDDYETIRGMTVYQNTFYFQCYNTRMEYTWRAGMAIWASAFSLASQDDYDHGCL